ncbi:oxygen-insensitive NADPH nitroreductase [Orbus sturtevantii]|uniref:oxygen-insensitive NADPH nitroreductase n=1 Tax=Orbus sturtevantii TaxID=3074109 RepID=UPI00370DD570
MNSTIDLLCRHRSIRAYLPTAITPEQIDAIFTAARAASSSSFLQCSSIIRITDSDSRKKIAHYAGDQNYVIQAPEFWIFCADFNRHYQIEPTINLAKAEQLLLGCIDTAIMAQNAVIAAESLGLGCVYIGGIRNNIQHVTDLLKLPKFVLPLFGLCIGHANQNPELKPRLPKSLLFFTDQYQPLDQAQLKQYDAQLAQYYSARSEHQKLGGWSDKIAQTLNKEERDFMLNYLHKQGWILK